MDLNMRTRRPYLPKRVHKVQEKMYFWTPQPTISINKKSQSLPWNREMMRDVFYIFVFGLLLYYQYWIIGRHDKTVFVLICCRRDLTLGLWLNPSHLSCCVPPCCALHPDSSHGSIWALLHFTNCVKIYLHLAGFLSLMNKLAHMWRWDMSDKLQDKSVRLCESAEALWTLSGAAVTVMRGNRGQTGVLRVLFSA